MVIKLTYSVTVIIIQVFSIIGQPHSGRSFIRRHAILFVNHMIKDRIGWHEVPLAFLELEQNIIQEVFARSEK